MLSHCWVHLVKYIVVVTLMGKFWFQLLLWSHCWSKFALKEIVLLLLGHLQAISSMTDQELRQPQKLRHPHKMR